MATPKVFISSTCYDLGEVRDALATFIKDYGFDPVISEHGDVFYHPDLHTHDACLHEVSNCQILVLVVGGRFGGRYVSDKAKSVTNAEYEAAKKSDIPIFAFVKKEVLDSERLYRYKANQDKGIEFLAIEKQEDAPSLFDFISDVRGATKNNGYFPFERSQEIVELLRKQWAGMFFDFLKSRQFKSELESQSALLSSLIGTSKKLEDLVKQIYTNVDKSGEAERHIEIADLLETAWVFLSKINDMFDGKFYPDAAKFASVEPANLSVEQFLCQTGYFSIHDEVLASGERIPILEYKLSKRETKGFPVVVIQRELQKLFERGLARLGTADRHKLMHDWIPF